MLKIAVRKLAGNSVVKEFDGAAFDFVSWTPDSKNLIYTLPDIIREGENLWLQSIEGGLSKLLPDTKIDKVLWVDW